MKRDLLRLTAAEFLGTFALVFVGCSTRAMVGETTNFAGILIVHIAFAFTIAAMIYTLSHISAAVFNPALTLGFAVCVGGGPIFGGARGGGVVAGEGDK